MSALAEIERQCGTEVQPLWAARADMLSELDDAVTACVAYDRAIALATEAPVIAFLNAQRAKIIARI